MQRLAIFASGSGSNAQKFMEYFTGHAQIEVSLILSNKPQAKVLERAHKFSIKSQSFTRADLYENGQVLQVLQEAKIDWIILAGFLWLIPSELLAAYPQKIINIHPALLPKYGGAGMYGQKVHQAVKAAGESQSGITIHYANEEFDQGEIIFQTHCHLSPEDSPESIAEKVQELEHKHFPKVVERLLENQ